MFFMWLLPFVIVFASSALLFFYFRKGINGDISNKRKITAKVVLGSVCAVLAAVSFLFLILAVNLADRIGEPEEVHIQTNNIVSLVKVNYGEDGGYLSEDNDRYLYFYRDGNNKVQAGYADIEHSKKFPGSLNGEAFVVIKTTYYEYPTKWMFFTGFETVSVETYDFYIP